MSPTTVSNTTTYHESIEDMSRFAARTVSKLVRAIEQSEGAGATVRRSIGTPQLRNYSPFLMLDHFSVKVGAGFPDHPHRGQETVTYMLDGAMQHEDFAGHAGKIETGDLQWMTAGKGIMHAEMPCPRPDGKPNVGLQLWVDLPSDYKLDEPQYQEHRDKDIPRAKNDKVEVKVISGEALNADGSITKSPVRNRVGVWFLDVRIQPGGKLEQRIPFGWNTFLYTLTGKPHIAGKQVEPYHTIVLGREGDGVAAENSGEEEVRFVIIAGQPLDGQRCVQYGPFVGDSEEFIYQAFMDYQGQTNGFERAKGWNSKIGGRA
ncbi:pirin protein [Saitoella complicata NRRL Y-17804]|nr:pirin protein [Saitoella complicata NRRL Y-17804]ODQ52327.1 pirin protein [Saitoella complicata NRRL Y-17804]